MIKAIFWDFGGVMTTSPFEAFNRFESDHGLPADFIRTINATNPDDNAWAQFESSRIDLADFDQAFLAETKAAGYPIRGRQVIALLKGDIRPRMVKALIQCKRHYKVACLTNNMNTHDPDDSRNPFDNAAIAEVQALFDVIIESRHLGIRKPDPRFYEHACEQVGVKPSETVFLDDLGVNLKPARALGMTTIKVISEDQALIDLESTLNIGIERNTL